METVEQIDFGGAHFEEWHLGPIDHAVVLGRDLPRFRSWLEARGANVRHLAEFDDRAVPHEFVAHHVEATVSLDAIGACRRQVETIMDRARRAMLLLDIPESCTTEMVRRALQRELSRYAFRILYPGRLYKTPGIKVVLVEPRMRRIVLLLSDMSKAGKTETALSLGDRPGWAVVHGDEYCFGIRDGAIAAGEELRRDIRRLNDGSPFDPELFSAFLARIPEFRDDVDIVFDLYMPGHCHIQVVDFFAARGFFPVLCWLPKDLVRLAEQRRQDEERRRRIETSISWRLTAPLRLLGERLPFTVALGRRLLRRWRSLSAADAQGGRRAG